MQHVTCRNLPGPGDVQTWGRCTDPRDPRWDDSVMNQQDCEDAAADEFLAMPELLGDFLQELCDGHKQPVTLGFGDSVHELPIAHVVAALFIGHERQRLAAVCRLRQQFVDHHRVAINERGLEIWADQFAEVE